VLSHPGAKQAGESHAGFRAFGTAGAAADLAGNHQWADTAFGEIVVGRNSGNGDKDKEFGQKADHSFTQGALRGGRADEGTAKSHQLLLEDMLLRHAQQRSGPCSTQVTACS